MVASRPSAVLIVNPNSGRLPDQERERAIDALSERFRLDTVTTTGRDMGIDVAADAAAAGAKLVIAFGGDGLVNEVANGLAGTHAVLGIVPGGTMNVFARALDLPLDPIEAIDAVWRNADAPPRSVPLGKMDDRYFTFAAGCGFDAEAAERVERHLTSKQRFGEMFFYWSAFRVLASSYRHRRPTMTLTGSFGEVAVSMAVACNAGPYAYFANRAVNLTPGVDLEGGLDVFALRSMRIEALPFYVWRVAVSGDLTRHADAFYANNTTDFRLVSSEPFMRHVDGEPLEPATSARFSVVPGILKVCA